MKKWISLSVLAVVLFLLDFFFHDAFGLHDAFLLIVLFFLVQTLVLFRLDRYANEEWKIQLIMIKQVIRLLTALVFILVVFQTHDDHFKLVIQFFSLYLAFLAFEIILSLANLRRN